MRNLIGWCLSVTFVPASLIAQVARAAPRLESWAPPLSASLVTEGSSSGSSASEPHAVQWYEAAAVAGVVVAVRITANASILLCVLSMCSP